MSLTSFETAGLTVLETIASIVASLASAANPAYATIIGVAADAINTELKSITAGNTPTLHDPSVANAAAAVIAGVGTAAVQNNPKLATPISTATAAAESAIASALSPAPAPASP